MEGTWGGGGGGVGEEKDELHVCGLSSALLNIICKVLYTFTNPFTTKI